MTNEVLSSAGLVELLLSVGERRYKLHLLLVSLSDRPLSVEKIGSVTTVQTTPYAQIRAQTAGHTQKPQTEQCHLLPHIRTIRHACRNL